MQSYFLCDLTTRILSTSSRMSKKHSELNYNCTFTELIPVPSKVRTADEEFTTRYNARVVCLIVCQLQKPE